MNESDCYQHWPPEVRPGLAKCDQMLANGEIGAALRLLRTLPFPDGADLPFVWAQMLHASGLTALAFEAIQGVGQPKNSDPNALVRIALICADAGANAVALHHLEHIDDAELTERSLSTAATIADRIGDTRLQERFDSRSAANYPPSVETRRRLWRAAMARGSYAEAAGHLPSDQTRLREPLYQLQQIVDGNPVDVGKIVSLCKQNLDTALPSAAVAFLLKCRNVDAAISIAVDFAENPSHEEAVQLTETLDQLLVHRESLDFASHETSVRKLVRGIVRYLALRPERGYIRQRLVGLLSVERSGDFGLPIICAVAINLAHDSLTLGAEILEADGSPKLLMDSGAVEIAMGWLEERAPCVPGKTVLPANLISIDPDVYLASVVDLLKSPQVLVASEEDVADVKKWLLLGSAVAPHSKAPDFVSALFRIVGTRFAIAGYSQQARDVCEQLLDQSAVSQERAQAAWFAMADIYSRLHDPITSLVAFACALAGRRGMGPLTGFNEMNVWVRLLRGADLFDHALDALDATDVALKEAGTFEKFRHHQEHIRLTVEFEHALASPTTRSALLPGLLERACRGADEAIARGEEATQALSLVSQMINLCRIDGVAVPELATSTLSMLMGGQVSARSLFEALVSRDDCADSLWTLYRSIDQARYADDAAFDSKPLTVAARDLLTRVNPKTSADSLLLAFELLADSGIPAPGWIENPHPPKRFSNHKEIKAFLARLEESSVALVLAAFDNRGQLFSLRIQGGDAHIVEELGFRHEAFKKWSKTFPYDYCKDVPEPAWLQSKFELMLDSLNECQWASFPKGPTLVIFDTELCLLPSNLIRTDSNFLGQIQPVGAAPSLAWLAESFERKPSATPKIQAWISGAGGAGRTLHVVIDHLRDTFAEYEVELDTADQPPASLSGVDLAFVAAHGQLSPDGRYFHTVTDEGSLIIPAEALAKALRNARVVVLFVCSGGRADKTPNANTTNGLAKQLLAAGCSTVIASPWPMESAVAALWAPVFLQQWKTGAGVLDATFAANIAIRGDDPSRSLAMHVYGDPFQKFVT